MAISQTFIPRQNPTTTSIKIDAEEVIHNGNTVVRERVLLASGNSENPIDVGVKQVSGSEDNNAMCVVQTPQATGGSSSSVSVTSVAAEVLAANTARKALIVQNPAASTESVFIGASGVTDATGIEIEPGGSLTDESHRGAIYGIVTSSSQSIRVWEMTG